jgi:hypothetical protein
VGGIFGSDLLMESSSLSNWVGTAAAPTSS